MSAIAADQGHIQFAQYVQKAFEELPFSGVGRDEIEDEAVLFLTIAVDAAHTLLEADRFHGMS